MSPMHAPHNPAISATCTHALLSWASSKLCFSWGRTEIADPGVRGLKFGVRTGELAESSLSARALAACTVYPFASKCIEPKSMSRPPSPPPPPEYISSPPEAIDASRRGRYRLDRRVVLVVDGDDGLALAHRRHRNHAGHAVEPAKSQERQMKIERGRSDRERERQREEKNPDKKREWQRQKERAREERTRIQIERASGSA